jgi:iron complex outermembrane recepter protein
MTIHRSGIRGLGLKGMLQASLRIAALAAVLSIPRIALAQDAPQPQKDASLEEVVVTGSRVARSTFTTPNPVTVLDAKDIESLGLVNVGDVLAELPQNSNFFSAGNVGLGNFNVGAQLANLRGLNPFFGTRTLTLIDTERVVPTATGGGVDVTLIPSMLVARTEVVTGGASAVYGSDAVAGVSMGSKAKRTMAKPSTATAAPRISRWLTAATWRMAARTS